MTTSIDEAMQDAYEQKHGYDQEVVCDICRDALIARFWEGEAVDANDLDCNCGGRLQVT